MGRTGGTGLAWGTAAAAALLMLGGAPLRVASAGEQAAAATDAGATTVPRGPVRNRTVGSKQGDWSITVPAGWVQSVMPSDAGGYAFTSRNRTAAFVVYASKRWPSNQDFLDAQTKLVRNGGVAEVKSALLTTFAGQPAAVVHERVRANASDVVEVLVLPDLGTRRGKAFGVRVTTTLIPGRFDSTATGRDLAGIVRSLAVR